MAKTFQGAHLFGVYRLSLEKACSSFRVNVNGAVAGLMVLLLFLGLAFVLMALDYERYKSAKAKMDDLLDSAMQAAGIECRMAFMKNKKADFKDDVIPLVKRKFDEAFKTDKKMLMGGVSIKPGTTPEVRVSLVQNPLGDPSRCFIEGEYSAESANMLFENLGVPKYPIIGRGKVVADIDIISPIEVDFLLDTSGSMSTVADTADWKTLMAVTRDPQASQSDERFGCIFACHTRYGLMNEEPSKNIENLMAGQTINVEIEVDNGKKELISVPSPKLPGPPPVLHKLAAAGPGGKNLVTYGDVLQYMNIRLKSDILAEAMDIALDNLRKSQNPDISIAMHRFSRVGDPGGFDTVVPDRGGSGRGISSGVGPDYASLKDFNPTSTALHNYFEYSIPCGRPSFLRGEAVYGWRGEEISLTRKELEKKLDITYVKILSPILILPLMDQAVRIQL